MLSSRYKLRKAPGEMKKQDENQPNFPSENFTKKSKGKRKRRTKASPKYKPLDENSSLDVSRQSGYLLRERNRNKNANETKKPTTETYQTVSDYYLKLQNQGNHSRSKNQATDGPPRKSNKCDCQAPDSDDEDFCKSLKAQLGDVAFHCRKVDSISTIKKLAAEINMAFQSDQPGESTKAEPADARELGPAVPCLVPQYKWLYHTPSRRPRKVCSPSRSSRFLLSHNHDKFLLGFSTPQPALDPFGLGNANKPLFSLLDQQKPDIFPSEDRGIFSEDKPRFGGFCGGSLDACPFEQDLQRDFQAGCAFEDRLGFGEQHELSPEFPRLKPPSPIPFFMKFNV